MSANDIVDTFCKLQRGVVVAEIVFAKGHMDLTKTVLGEVKGYCENLLTRLGEVNGKEDGANQQHAEANPKRNKDTARQSGNASESGRGLNDGNQKRPKAKRNVKGVREVTIATPKLTLRKGT